MIQYVKCPLCGSGNIKPCLKAKDHTVSQQYFVIWQCENCQLRFTQDVPDEQEIRHFYQSENYISHTDTRKGVINRLYHVVRRITLNRKRRLIISQTKTAKGKILDIGSGTGAFLNVMQKQGWHVTGLEPDEAARRKAMELYRISSCSPEKLFQLEEGSYDVITLWHVLEHVHDLQGYLAQIKKNLAKGGVLFIAAPNYTSKDAVIYKEHWAAYDVPRHLYHFSPASVKVLLQQHGLQLKKIQPMWFDAFYISLLSEKYKNGKSSFIKALWNGLCSNYTALKCRQRASSIIYIIEKR